jgi:hypothetical protein
LAFKEKRFLLTKNEKDFFDNATVPFHRTHGIIAIHGNMSNILDYAIAIEHLLRLIVQYGEMGVPSRPSLAYNLPNSQWYIQWLRTLRNRGTERVPKRLKAGRRVNADRLFLYGCRR